jgi:hypothetical protein
MSDPAAAGADPVAFAERVLALLDSGSFTTSYKYAVLLAIVDCCLEQVDGEGAAPSVLHAHELAAKVLERYWRQAVPFHATGTPTVLRQRNERAKRDLVTRIAEFRRRVGPQLSIVEARRADPAGFAELRALVEVTVVRMPLPKLQRIAAGDPFGDGFMYRVGWPNEVSAARVMRGDFDDRVHLKPGVGELLVRLAGVIRPVVQREWAHFVARRNSDVLAEVDLDGFLFGVERVALDRVRAPLTHLQDGACFYCGDALRATADLDHFLPWSRCGDDGLDNLVAAHPRCNNRKRNSLAAPEHLERWMSRSQVHGSDLGMIATDAGWLRDWRRTLGGARALYLHQPASLPLWLADDRYVAADPDRLRPLLAGTAAHARAAEGAGTYTTGGRSRPGPLPFPGDE